LLWVLGTGAQWRELPEKYPPYQTCHRRFQQWIRDGKLIEVLRLLAQLLHEQGKLNLDEAFVDAPLQEAMESRAPLRMDAQLPVAREPVGVPHRQLPRNGPSSHASTCCSDTSPELCAAMLL
jgi:hypothetical protein